MTANEKSLVKALERMLALHADIMKSNNVGNMCFQDYALLNEAPMEARKAIASTKAA